MNPPIQGVVQYRVMGLQRMNDNVLHGMLDGNVIVRGDNDIMMKIGNGQNNVPNDGAQLSPVYDHSYRV